MTAREAYIALNMVTDLGPVRVRNLIDTLGSPEEILKAGPDQLARAKGIGKDLAVKIADQAQVVDPSAEIAKAKKIGAHLVTPLDEEYPASLKEIYDPPLALYVRGTLEKRDKHAIAMVGSRRCTHYGRQTADRFGYQLAKAGFTVNSGLARGIDTAAHLGALKAKGRTIAVLGGALDKLYPPENEQLAEDIAKSGAVISEYALGREPDRTTFPYRNRVVSGMSMGILVVEAPVKSGALITVDQALDQGRSVFAVPGRIDAPASRGCNNMIKNGARLVEDIDDILKEFEFLLPVEEVKQEARPTSRPAVFNPEEEKVVTILVEGETDIDTLSRQTEIPTGRLSSVLLGLEMKRIVTMLPGRRVALAVEIPV